ncbi:unnamed protein product [Brassica oleracea]
MPQVSRNMQGRFSGRGDSGPGHVSSFGASATAKISVDASLAGAIIGKGGVSSKQIYRQTGAKLTIQDHERDPNLKNIELEGTFEQINEASVMVRELIGRLNSAARRPPAGVVGGIGSEGKPHPGSNFKTKKCERFSKGSCTFGDRCHFAHGEAELRREGVFQTPCDDDELTAAWLAPKRRSSSEDKSPLHPFLLCVSDLLLLGRATIEESRSLLIHWLDTEEGFGKMGVCGRVVWHGSALEAPREELEAQKITMILDQVRERERG